MVHKKNNLMGGLILATGVIIGAATALFIKESRPIRASEVLSQVKKSMSEHGEITGSWIDYDPLEYDLFENAPLVYIGGITIKSEDGEFKVYQFAADIYSGDLIDYFQINPK